MRRQASNDRGGRFAIRRGTPAYYPTPRDSMPRLQETSLYRFGVNDLLLTKEGVGEVYLHSKGRTRGETVLRFNLNRSAICFQFQPSFTISTREFSLRPVRRETSSSPTIQSRPRPRSR